jgi:hypothetical protein|tara:strand:- start:775 stop:1011 length:237 start_codon:yes stop_codon:yes gene_type:complete
MSFKSRLTQAVKDYGTAAKVQCKMACKIAQGAGVDELNKAAEDFEPIFNNSQRLKDVQKVGYAVGAAFWTGVICAIVD